MHSFFRMSASRVGLLRVHFNSGFTSKMEHHFVIIKRFASILNIEVHLTAKPIIKRGRKAVILQMFSHLIIVW